MKYLFLLCLFLTACSPTTITRDGKNVTFISPITGTPITLKCSADYRNCGYTLECLDGKVYECVTNIVFD